MKYKKISEALELEFETEEELIAALMTHISEPSKHRDNAMLEILDIVDPLLNWFASRCPGQCDFEEMKAEATAVAIKAMTKFDATRGAGFKTFLTLNLRSLTSYRLKQSLCTSIPSNLRFISSYIKGKLEDEEPSRDDERINLVDNGRKLVAKDIGDVSETMLVDDDIERSIMLDKIYELTLKLNEKERAIVRGFFFSNRGLSKKEFIDNIGVSRQTVDFHINKAVRRLASLV